jgi:hypothetical protein
MTDCVFCERTALREADDWPGPVSLKRVEP